MKDFKNLIREAHLGNPLNEVNNSNIQAENILKKLFGKKLDPSVIAILVDEINDIIKKKPSIKDNPEEIARELAKDSDIDPKLLLKPRMGFIREEPLNEEFSSTEQKMINQIKSYKKRGSAVVNLPSKVRDFYFKNKEKIDALNEELKLGVKYELPTGETGYIMTGGSKDPKDWKFTGNKEPYLSVKDKLKPTEKQPEKYDGAFDMGMGKGHHIDEGTNENINDPVLVKTRAAQMKRDAMDKKDLENKSKRISVDKAIDLRYELSILDKEREDILMRIEDIGVEMDQTAEPEGGPIADKLGERLMAAQRELRAIDSKIIDIKDDLGVFDMNEIVDEEIETSLTPNEIDDEAIEKESASPSFESLYRFKNNQKSLKKIRSIAN